MWAIHGEVPNTLVVVGGAPFIGGSDDYGKLWAQHAGFGASFVRDFKSVSVDRANRRVVVDPRVPEASPAACRGKDVVLFVEAVKEPNATDAQVPAPA